MVMTCEWCGPSIPRHIRSWGEDEMNSSKVSRLKDQALWWYAAHVADFNTAVTCVSRNDDRLIQQITNRFFQRKQLRQYRRLFNLKTQGSLQRPPANISEWRKNIKSILSGLFNNCFRGLGELIKNNEKNEVDDVHYNHWPIQRCVKQFFRNFKLGSWR